jgi:hypothetical protein
MSMFLIDIGLAGAIGTGIVFVEAGLAKLRHRDLVPGVVANYRLLPETVVAPVAALLPIVELGLGLGLIASVMTAGSVQLPGSVQLWSAQLLALPAAALLLVFAAAMAINIRRGRQAIDCGCGRSHLRQPLSWSLVVRNGVLAVLVAMHALPPGTGDSVSPVDIALALFAGVALFGMVLLFNTLAALAASPLASGRR